MADGILTLQGFSDFNKLHKDYDKLLTKVTRLEGKLADVGKKSKSADRAQSSMMTTATRHAAQMIASYTSINALISAGTQGLRDREQLQKKAALADMSLAEVQVQLRANLGVKATEVEQATARRLGIELGLKTGLGAVGGTMAIGQAMSAQAGSFQQRIGPAVEGVETAAPMFLSTERRHKAGGFVGASLALARGIPGVNVREAMGIMAAVQGQGRGTDIEKLKEFVPAVVSATVAAPKVPREEFALQMLSMSAAMSQRIEDPDLSITKTAMAAFANSLYKFGGKGLEDTRLPFTVIDEMSEKQKKAVFKNLMGKQISKGAQAEFVRGALSLEMAKEDILPQLKITPSERESFFAGFKDSSPSIKRQREAMIIAAESQERLRLSQSAFGNARNVLFGGGNVEVGALESHSRNIPDFLRRWHAWALFGLKEAAGGSLEDATQAAYLGFTSPIERYAKDDPALKQRNDEILDVLNRINESSGATAASAEDTAGSSNADSQRKANRE